MKNTLIIGASLLGLLLVDPASAASCKHPKLVAKNSTTTNRMGTDTGNGGGGVAVKIEVLRYSAIPTKQWCNNVSSWLAEILRRQALVHSSGDLREVRDFITESIEAVLDGLDRAQVPMEPLTYSLLTRALQINDVFPYCDSNANEDNLGNQVAIISLYHMIKTAMSVSSDFDVPVYLDWYEKCHGGCSYSYKNPYDVGPFYISYMKSAKAVVSQFFNDAIPDQPGLGNVFDSMAKNRWELKAVKHILEWMDHDISKDPFKRGFACVQTKVQMVHKFISDYLDGRSPSQGLNDYKMRKYTRSSLEEIRDLFGYYEYKNSRGYCSSTHTHYHGCGHHYHP